MMFPLIPAWSLQGDILNQWKWKAKRCSKKIDLKTTHEKDYVILPQQVVALADTGCNIINIMCDESDAISGCDKVGFYLGIGKTKVIKAWSAGIELNHLGDPKSSLDDAMKESTHLIGASYGQSVIHPTQCIQSGMGITHWAKGGQYPSGAQISSAYCGSL